MQNKGALKLLVALLVIACAFQLSFTFVARNVQSKAEQEAPANQQGYLDSMKNEVVYNLGIVKYTYSECLEREINLGLDLRGGMNVTLEIAIEDVLKSLAGPNAGNAEFNKALADARKAQASDRSDFLTLFAKAYQQNNPEGRLATVFGTTELREKITPASTNEEVLKVLRTESSSAIDNAFRVLSDRINRFGVVQPNIQRLGTSGRILVELPGVKDPVRVSKLLQGTANLEFWTTYTAEEMAPRLNQADQVTYQAAIAMKSAEASQNVVAGDDADVKVDSTEIKIDSTGAVVDTTSTTTKDDGVESLFDVLQIYGGPSAVIGLAQSYDTVKVNNYLNMPQVRTLFSRDVRFMWSIKPMKDRSGVVTNLYELYAIKGTPTGKAPLDGAAVSDASSRISDKGGSAEVSMSMYPAGARVWAQLTRQNIDRSIAVVLDGYVYSCPRVNAEITGGSSSITGDFTIQEAKDLANVLNSGKLAAPARIVQESVVGPTLGKESISSGMLSFILAFSLVLLYMIFFYNKAGLVASIALIANLFFLFGVLVSFGAVLTLPGIAGIVLTMGMAVDANVIIYERIKEELRAGKAIGQSLKDGFSNAYSAIIDGNMTTLITGIVLFIFGSGPVQGFATTLIIGIITSLFCAIFITRIIFDGMVNKGRKVSFSNRMTENFLGNTKVDFIKSRKFVYVLAGIIITVMIGSLAMKGLNYGIDFTGGRTYVVRFDKEVTADEVRSNLSNVFEDDCVVKQYGTSEQKQMSITTQFRYDDAGEDVTHEINLMMYEALKPMYDGDISVEDFTTTVNNPLGIISAQKVSAAIAHDIVINSFIAVLFALIMIGLYIALRFRKWQYGVGGVVSLAHDALLTLGVFSLFSTALPFNLTIDQSFIAAILTIIGYSINDTVIIFDRIRENVTNHPKTSLKDNMNNAMNQTLARTVNTAGSTIVVLLAIFIFGGEVIRGFVFALLFGVVIGTFSSIFIATPIAYDLMRKSDAKKMKQIEK